MTELLYAQFRDYRGHVIEQVHTPILGRKRYIVWKDLRRLGLFRDAIQAERFVEENSRQSA